eukprot:gene8213-11113_t
MKIPIVVFFIFLLRRIVGEECGNSYQTKCNIQLGTSNNDIRLAKNDEFYAFVTIPDGQSQLDIIISTYYGSVEVYASERSVPTLTNYNYSSVLSRHPDYLRVFGSSKSPFNLLIKAQFLSKLNLIAASPNTIQTLSVGIPQKSSLGKSTSSIKNFQFTLSNKNKTDIVLTTYHSVIPTMTLTYPTGETVVVEGVNYEKGNYSSRSSGYLSFTPKSSPDGSSLYNLKVESSSNWSTFSVGVRSEYDSKHPMDLFDGVPQYDRVAIKTQQFYLYQVSGNISKTDTISIVLDSIVGDADLYVNPISLGCYRRLTSDPFAVWSSQRQKGKDTITIQSNDPQFVRTEGAYCITVFGYAYAEYTLRASSANTVVTLVEGHDTQGSVSKGGYRYFRFYDTSFSDHSAKNIIMFDLFPTIGDADFSISCQLSATGDDSGYPSKLSGHYNFTSQRYLEDTIAIPSSDPNACKATGVYYIAVFGYQDSQFSLGVMHSGGAITLRSGIPRVGTVYKQLSLYYLFKVGFEASDLKIIITPQYGDVDLYVKKNNVASLNDYDFRSIANGNAIDQVVIKEEDICQDCFYSILVYGFLTSRFTILATLTDDTILLTNGLPQKGSVASNSIQYYSYTTSNNCTATAVLSLTSGTPVIYLSTTVMYPNETSPNTTKNYMAITGVLSQITTALLRSQQNIYVGVGGYGTNATFTIRISESPAKLSDPPTLLTLLDGIPQSDSISSEDVRGWKYYQISVPMGHETISIRSTILVGNVDLYVIKCKFASVYVCSQDGNLPNTTHYMLSTIDDTDRNNYLLNIFRNDPTDMLYVVGVYTTSMYASYQISSTFSNSILALQPGVSVMDHVGVYESDYFSFFLDQTDENLKISLTRISGDPDLYISTKLQRPSPSNFTWKSIRYGSDVIEIDPLTDKDACFHCTYYILVYGTSESVYSIGAALSSSIPQLQDGIPVSGSVGVLKWAYYVFVNQYGSSRNIKISLTSKRGNADIYVKLDGTKPTYTNYDYKSNNMFSSDDTINILYTDSQYAVCLDKSNKVGCTITIGVLGFDLISSDFSITLTTSSSATLLQLGTSQTGTTALNDSTLYKVMLSQQTSNAPFILRLTVIPLAGHVSLYVNCYSKDVSLTNYQWKLSPVEVGSYLDIASMSIADFGCARSSQISMAVHGDNSAAAYSILAIMVSNSTIPLLTTTQTLSGLVPNRQMNYYYFYPAALYQDLRFTATVTQGDVDLYVSATWDTKPYVDKSGNVKSYVAKSATIGSENFVLSHDSIQKVCAKRDQCYLILAVCGVYVSSTSSSYLLSLSTQDSTVTLLNGIPTRSHVSSGQYQYFKYSYVQPNIDLFVSVTPIYGDPDVYIGLGFYPTRNNYTWFQALVGADAGTYQAPDIATKCVPNPSIAKMCQFYIGVYGWKNTSFSILASTDEGFKSPITLIDKQPQQGHVEKGRYVYYKYKISGDGPTKESVSIKFILTPTDGGDVDLYLSFSNLTEPGINHYDYKSTGWSTAVEQIEVSVNMPHYCLNCIAYLAVSGYKAGNYLIQATSTGIITLQADNAVSTHISPHVYSYFTYYNTISDSVLIFTLTVLQGDADLYITTRKASDKSANFPTAQNYKWRSMRIGSDVIQITYMDSNFCVDCEYIVGVYGFKNSTCTLLVSSKEDSLIYLAANRPQRSSIDKSGKLKYFGAMIGTSLTRIGVSLTPLNTGSAIMYLQLYNASLFSSAGGGDGYSFPNPNDPSSYKYSTIGTKDNHITVSGVYSEAMIFIVAVVAISPIDFTMIYTTSQSSVILQSGVPQNHFVSNGQNELFQFIPNNFGEDVRVVLTARSGDPDLLVSSVYSNPHCDVDPSNNQIKCSNFTWGSFLYSTDQIIISQDHPCDKQLSSTYINPLCNPDTAFKPGQPIYIDIFGFKSAKFSIMASSVGEKIQLLAGQPQLSSTAPSYICSDRSKSTGACLSSSKINKKVQVGYFSFQVTSNAAARARQLSDLLKTHSSQASLTDLIIPISDVIISVIPNCNLNNTMNDNDNNNTITQPSLEHCPSGCDCNPLILYINSCPISKCTEIDMKPSELKNQHQASMIIRATTGSTLFLSSIDEVTAKPNTAFCDPLKAKEDCMYFVGLSLKNSTFKNGAMVPPATFTVTARTPGDVNLIPCSSVVYPDGIIMSALEEVKSGYVLNSTNGQMILRNGGEQYYEVCASKGSSTSNINSRLDVHAVNEYVSRVSLQAAESDESLIIQLEQCSGDTALMACAENSINCEAALPTPSNWDYFSNKMQYCLATGNARKKITCKPNDYHKTMLILPAKEALGNYYLMANGTGKFMMTIEATRFGGKRLSPSLVYAGINYDVTGSIVEMIQVTGNTVTLKWRQAQVIIPGLKSPVFAYGMRYLAYIIDKNALISLETSDSKHNNIYYSTNCGLILAAETYDSAIDITPAIVNPSQSQQDFMQHLFVGLKNNKQYRIIINAICDSSCLRQLSKTLSSSQITPLISCNEKQDCKSQNIVYSSIDILTNINPDEDDTLPIDNNNNSIIIPIVVISIIFILLFLIGGGAYYYKYRQLHSQSLSGNPVFTIEEDDDIMSSSSVSGKSTTELVTSLAFKSPFSGFGDNKKSKLYDKVNILSDDSLHHNKSSSLFANDDDNHNNNQSNSIRNTINNTYKSIIGSVGSIGGYQPYDDNNNNNNNSLPNNKYSLTNNNNGGFGVKQDLDYDDDEAQL